MTNSLFKIVCLFALFCLCASPLSAQETKTIASIDFDTNEPLYQYSFGFVGYGDPQTGQSVSAKGQVTVSKTVANEGVDTAIMELEAKAAKLAANSSELSDTNQQIKSLRDKNKCSVTTLDSTKIKIPEDATYDYAGWGTGSCFEMGGKKLPSADLSKYRVSFDAKAAGTATLTNSKLRIAFVVDDDKVKADSDDNDDIVFELIQGAEEGDGCFSITSDFQNFSFPLDKMIKRRGDTEALKTTELKGITFTVQAQGATADLGKDTDNILYVDNLRLTYEQ